MCVGFLLCPENLAHLTCCEEILIRVTGACPSSAVVSPVGMLNFQDKPSCYLSVGFTVTFSPCLLTGGFICGSNHFWILPGTFCIRVGWAICMLPKSENKVQQVMGFLLQDSPLNSSGPGPSCGATWTERMWEAGGTDLGPWLYLLRSEWLK